MDLRKVKKLIELLEESTIAEIEIHEGEESVRISRVSKVAPSQAVYEVPARVETSAPVPAATAPSTAPAVVDAVTAPMVGTFYTSPTPSAPAFKQLGQPVRRGEVLCIIEAMKIMNQIESDRDGTLRAVLAENGQPVEYGQPLFVID